MYYAAVGIEDWGAVSLPKVVTEDVAERYVSLGTVGGIRAV